MSSPQINMYIFHGDRLRLSQPPPTLPVRPVSTTEPPTGEEIDADREEQ